VSPDAIILVLWKWLKFNPVRASRADPIKEAQPSIIALANGWVTINVGGGPTADKPTGTLEAPRDFDRVSAFLNIRVADLAATIREWSAREAQLLTPPIDCGVELRCYMRDPDGHLIEVARQRAW
jgi:catechol 2,3-dioxygenase-like lactoylglutathione lyase family enzyme